MRQPSWTFHFIAFPNPHHSRHHPQLVVGSSPSRDGLDLQCFWMNPFYFCLRTIDWLASVIFPSNKTLLWVNTTLTCAALAWYAPFEPSFAPMHMTLRCIVRKTKLTSIDFLVVGYCGGHGRCFKYPFRIWSNYWVMRFHMLHRSPWQALTRLPWLYIGCGQTSGVGSRNIWYRSMASLVWCLFQSAGCSTADFGFGWHDLCAT